MLRAFLNSEEGNYAAIFAIAIIPIMAGVAGAVDFVSISMKGVKLQNMLDATALAIGTKYYSGMTKDEIEAFGREFFLANMYGGPKDDVEFDFSDDVQEFAADETSDGSSKLISATSTIDHEGFFGGFSSNWRTNRRSYVRVAPGQPACVLALDPHASSSVKIQGSTQVTLTGCVIASNSDASDSIYRGGTAKLAAKCVLTSGGTVGVESNSNASLDCDAPLENQYPSLDPLADVNPPPYTTCRSMPGGKTKTLSPGTYCNKTWSGDITLEPGIYILRGGQIKLGGNGRLVGHGVTIFLMDGAEFQSNANEVVQLSPSDDEPYAGITIYQERGNTSPLTINGGSGSDFSGFIYAPSAHVSYAGNASMSGAGDCIRIVGKTIEMAGNSNVSADCEAQLGGREMNAGRKLSLVR
jgi:Flp pilus assembly protein TadG